MVQVDAGTLLFAAIFTNNILLTNFLGLCPFLSISRDFRSSAGLGVAVVFVMTCTAAINFLVYYHILVPLHLEHFRYIIFIIIIASFVQLVEISVERFFPALYFVLGIFLPLITVNCAILGASLFLIIREYTLVQSVAYGAGSGIGWLLAIVVVGSIREKIQKTAKLPKGLEGPAITLIITGLMSLAFIAFSGMIQIQ
ncbi:MAG: NADH:ubiquinone reductase (Na(+)-transporting) subunit E [Deltaproteobacteria bacterium]|nr:NADH:ubiquinone reductase (Na(+)-transporting) subunit E [Deltaproteobacteria bacterium]MBW2207046.1 NADH:ubiquinone reductase (Na(+)-transporting) subunit E [Deltaproteobacteria bacterium]